MSFAQHATRQIARRRRLFARSICITGAHKEPRKGPGLFEQDAVSVSPHSLLCRKESLLLRSKFPVPLSREFWL
jgi:hypothetical protein